MCLQSFLEGREYGKVGRGPGIPVAWYTVPPQDVHMLWNNSKQLVTAGCEAEHEPKLFHFGSDVRN